MRPRPTGRIERDGDGFAVSVFRVFADSPSAVWADVTESDRTATWIGSWEGDGRVGGTVTVRFAFEDGFPTSDLRIDECERERLLAVTMLDDAGEWRLRLTLDEPDDEPGATRLTLTQHLDSDEDLADVVASIGPGWEYYLDMLVAARSGRRLPDFDDYYPSQSGHFSQQVTQRH